MADIDAMIREVEREVRTRENIYPRWIAQDKISKGIAEKRLSTMRDVLDLLHGEKAKGQLL